MHKITRAKFLRTEMLRITASQLTDHAGVPHGRYLEWEEGSIGAALTNTQLKCIAARMNVEPQYIANPDGTAKFKSR